MFIFQPAEEGLGGARRMIADGLFKKFPCDEIYGLHNWPSGNPGVINITPGKALAGADFFDITLTAKGCHAAAPDAGIDSIVIASSLVQQLQSIVSRNVEPSDQIVLSVTQFHAGAAYNVLPEVATLAGTMRYFNRDTAAMVRTRMQDLCAGMAKSYGVQIALDMRNVFDVLKNNPTLSEAMIDVAQGLVGTKAQISTRQVMGSEDFADMLQVVPGAYCMVGHAGAVPLHNPGYVFDDAALPLGVALLARMVEVRGEA